MHFAEFGVVLLLFSIGLELQPARLWTFRSNVFGLGLALSSTAFVLQILAERGELKDRHGRAAFAILLFQDIAAIPVLAVAPLLGAGYAVASGSSVSFTLLKVAGVLGAFLAGMLLANSEYRHQLEADIEPFKGLLLGLFFISVGMALNLGLLRESAGTVGFLVAGLLIVKGVVVYGLGQLWGLNHRSSKSLGLAIPQGGEFAFVIFTAAVTAGIMSKNLEELLVLVVTVDLF